MRAHSPGVSPHLQSMSLYLYKPTFVLILKCQFPAKLHADFLLISSHMFEPYKYKYLTLIFKCPTTKHGEDDY